MPGLRFVVESEEIATHTVDVWLHDAHHGVRCDGRVDGVATFFEYVCAGLRSEKLRSCDYSEFRYDHGAALSGC